MKTIHDRANQIFNGWTEADRDHYGDKWQDAWNLALTERVEARFQADRAEWKTHIIHERDQRRKLEDEIDNKTVEIAALTERIEALESKTSQVEIKGSRLHSGGER